MFGYIRPCKPEMKIREYEGFKAVYCGLCHQLGRSFGPFARLTLSYDFTFLAMVRYAQGNDVPLVEQGRCAVNPLHRVPLCQSDATLRYTADVAALMLHHKLLDNLRDQRGIKRLGYRLLRPFTASAARKAERREPAAAGAIAALTREQQEVEETFAGIDAAAEPTAKVLATLCRELSKDKAQRRVLERFGYLTGRFIYLCDALEDLEEDRKQGSFNPLLNRLGETDGPQDSAALYQEAKDSLFLTIGEAARTCELLRMDAYDAVIRNIVYLGMPEQVERILSGKEQTK